MAAKVASIDRTPPEKPQNALSGLYLQQPLYYTSYVIKAKNDPCWNELIFRESGWRITATNKSSGAYGLPQSLPPEKMAEAGDDWRTNPETQLKWMENYIEKRYGTTCNALNFQIRNNFY